MENGSIIISHMPFRYIYINILAHLHSQYKHNNLFVHTLPPDLSMLKMKTNQLMILNYMKHLCEKMKVVKLHSSLLSILKSF